MIGIALLELASALNYAYVGNPAALVRNITFAEEACAEDLAICRTEREVLITHAEVVLTPPKIIKTKKALLYSSDPIEVGAIQAAQTMIQIGILPDYSIPGQYTTHGQWMAGQNCEIASDTVIGPFCVIGSRVKIGAGCIIDPHVWIGADVEIGDHVRIHSGAKIGAPAFYHYGEEQLRSFYGVGTVHIADNVEIGCQSVIQRGTFSDTRIGPHTYIGDLVEIGHDVHIGCDCKIVSQTGLAGNAIVGNHVLIYGQSGVANHVKIGDYAVIMAKASVTKDVAAGKTVGGPLGRSWAEELRFQVKLRKTIGGKENGMR